MIEVKNLTKVFKKPIRGKGFKGMFKSLFSRKHQEIIAVNDISFSIAEGESVGYIGANGAGKSTTIKMLSGILTPTSGEVYINGFKPYSSKQRNKVLKDIGVVFGQRTQLWWDLPVSETFELLKQIYEIPEREYQERYTYLKEVLGIEKFLTSPVRTLSLGQRMRADLAASLIHNPRVLFLDEPTIGLDVLVKRKVIEAMKEIQQKYKTTIILTTHDMADIESLCSRVIIIDEGKLLYDGSLEHIKNKFGDVRNITMETNDLIEEESFRKEFGEKILRYEVEDGKIVLSIDAAKVHVNEILSFAFAKYAINDIKIAETSIEQVVEKIYANKEI